MVANRIVKENAKIKGREKVVGCCLVVVKKAFLFVNIVRKKKTIKAAVD